MHGNYRPKQEGLTKRTAGSPGGLRNANTVSSANAGCRWFTLTSHHFFLPQSMPDGYVESIEFLSEIKASAADGPRIVWSRGLATLCRQYPLYNPGLTNQVFCCPKTNLSSTPRPGGAMKHETWQVHSWGTRTLYQLDKIKEKRYILWTPCPHDFNTSYRTASGA